ncbi:type I-E CRISPR-associated protein Cas5/CasD [Leptospira sp. WS92.C1]
MSSENAFIVLRLQGPLQSWGFDSQYNRRNTGLMPTKSGIAGICCAALGYGRGSETENRFLKEFLKVKMITIALPRKDKASKSLPIGRLQDYHTVHNTREASGGIKESHITRRYYLTDADFGVILNGEKLFLDKITENSNGYGLKNPVWGIWLGRKSCIPSIPVYVGILSTYEDALKLLIGDQSIDSFDRQEEVGNFADGVDTIMDSAVSFDSNERIFLPRRIQTFVKKETI